MKSDLERERRTSQVQLWILLKKAMIHLQIFNHLPLITYLQNKAKKITLLETLILILLPSLLLQLQIKHNKSQQHKLSIIRVFQILALDKMQKLRVSQLTTFKQMLFKQKVQTDLMISYNHLSKTNQICLIMKINSPLMLMSIEIIISIFRANNNNQKNILPKE